MAVRPKVYIAAPFFNAAQHDIVDTIEDLLERRGFDYYSPRKDSGSHLIAPEDRKNHEVWKPVLDSNIQAIETCGLMIAVVEYAMPAGWKLAVAKPDATTSHGHIIEKHLELPDNGVVFECGYALKARVPVVGYHSFKPLDEMNLMLSHTMEGLLTGIRALDVFLYGIRDIRDGTTADSWVSFSWGTLEKFEGEVI